MLKKLILSLVIALLLANTLTLASNVCRVEADESIHIMANGSIEGTTRIQTLDNMTYLFLGDINGSITVERNYIVIDGDGHALQGNGTGTGISLSERTNVTVQGLQITGFDNGISIDSCSNTTIFENNIVKNAYGILFADGSSNSDVLGNNITANGVGIRTDGMTDLDDAFKVYRIYHNNFVGNGRPRDTGYGWVGTIFWNLSYPSGGNFWSDYDGIDSKNGSYQDELGSDGIGDTPYSFAIPGRMGSYDTMLTDSYPLTVPFGSNLPLAFPTADFTYTPSEPLANETVEFNASTSICINGTIDRFKWDFGDGKTDTGPIVSHVYETQGNYNVTLIVISSTFIPETKHQSIFIARVPAWQTWTVVSVAVLLIAGVAVVLALSIRRGRLKKSDRQAKLLSGH